MRLSRGPEANELRCVEAANVLIRVHKASTQNRKLRTKTSKISMSQRDNRKSCHSDQLSSHEKSSWGTIWGTKRSPREHLLCFFKHAANSLKPGHAAYGVGKKNLRVADLVGAAMCSAFKCGSHDRWP